MGSRLPGIGQASWEDTAMDFLIDLLIFAGRLALAGFVIWGGWLCMRHWLEVRRGAEHPAAESGAEKRARLDRLARIA